jgi:hypothetical protein
LDVEAKGLGCCGGLWVKTGDGNIRQHVWRAAFDLETDNEVTNAVFGQKDNGID